MDRLDKTSSLLNRTQKDASNHAKKLSDYQLNIVAIYEQLKQTAKFLTDIIHSLGIEGAQAELLLQKINKLQLDMKEGNEVSEQVVNDTQKFAAELTKMSALIEESLRVSVPTQSGSMANPQHEKSSEELAIKNDELTQKFDKVTAKMAVLKAQLRTVQKERNKLESKAKSASKNEEKWMKKYANAMKLVEERDEELKNREHIIEDLQSVASKKVDLPVDLKEKTDEETHQSDSTLTDDSKKVHK